MPWIAIYCVLCCAGKAAAQASSGGDFVLEQSAVPSGGGGTFSGGNFTALSIAGEQDFAALSPQRLLGGDWEVRRGWFDPPRFSLQGPVDNTVQGPSAKMSLFLASKSVPVSYFDVVLRQDPMSDPLRVVPGIIDEANKKMAANKGPLARILPGHVWEINIFSEFGFYDGVFSPPGTLSFSYKDQDQDGIVDGTDPPIRAKTMHLWMLDETQSQWVRVPDSTVDTSSRRMLTPLRHLSVYAAIGGADTSVEEVYAYPVPFRPYGPEAGTGPGQTGTDASGITFTNLPSEGRIELYTLQGLLVRKIEIPANLAPARLSWDARNEAGHSVASGVYLWRVVAGGKSKQGRIMIIR